MLRSTGRAPSRHTIAILGAATLLAASGVAAVAQGAPSDAAFLREASRGNQAEIAAARAILQTTTDPRIRAYAQAMIGDHSRAIVALESAAHAANLTVPSFRTVALGGASGPETPPPGRTTDAGVPVAGGNLSNSGAGSSSSAGRPATAAILVTASSAPQVGPQSYTDVDLSYLRNQVAAHEKMLALLESEAAGGKTASLKAYASDQTATVQKHLDIAQADLNNGGSPARPAAGLGPTALPSNVPLGAPSQAPASNASSAP